MVAKPHRRKIASTVFFSVTRSGGFSTAFSEGGYCLKSILSRAWRKRGLNVL